MLQDFNDAIAKAVEAQTSKDTVADEAMGFEHNIGPCHFGHVSSSQRVNGREAWLKTLQYRGGLGLSQEELHCATSATKLGTELGMLTEGHHFRNTS